MRKLWAKAKEPLLTFFALVGGVLAFVQFFGWWTPDSYQYILWNQTEKQLVSRSENFTPSVTIGASASNNEDVIETVITFWRDGGQPITPEMTRRPITISLPSGSRLDAYKLIAQESSVSDNFTVIQNGNNLEIRWRVFDPDMALKIAFVRSGYKGSISLTEEVGPTVKTSTKRYTASKWVFRIVVGAVSLLLGAAVAIPVLLCGFAFTSWASDRRAYLEFPAFIAGMAVFMTVAGGLIFVFSALNRWIGEAIVVPIPF